MASKPKKQKVRQQDCNSCGRQFDEERSQCPHCKCWNIANTSGADDTVLLSEVKPDPLMRIKNTGPWDRCFSDKGGIVTIGTTLIGGEPGAGKSTMALQLSDKLAEVTKREILIVSAEEAKEQVKAAAERLSLKNQHMMRVYPMGANTELGSVFRKYLPCAIIIDSLPGLTSDPGLAIDYCKTFKKYAIELGSPFLIIDHITKDHDLAGFMELQHEVDTTMKFTVTEEKVRKLETIKNRFGPTRHVYLDMTEKGLIQTQIFDVDDEVDPDWVCT